jgi:hypothetical protein
MLHPQNVKKQWLAGCEGMGRADTCVRKRTEWKSWLQEIARAETSVNRPWFPARAKT